MILNIILIVLIIVFSYILITYNSFVKSTNSVKESKSGIDILLKKRFDMIPNIVDTVKGYVKHEKGTLVELTDMRSRVGNIKNLGVNESAELDNKINNVLAVAEAYPELKANEQFSKLQDELDEIEDEIGYARTVYNKRVTSLNNKIESFPSELIARLFSFSKCELFKLSNDLERDNVKLDL